MNERDDGVMRSLVRAQVVKAMMERAKISRHSPDPIKEVHAIDNRRTDNIMTLIDTYVRTGTISAYDLQESAEKAHVFRRGMNRRPSRARARRSAP